MALDRRHHPRHRAVGGLRLRPQLEFRHLRQPRQLGQLLLGARFNAGLNAGRGKDDTLFALVGGAVKFGERRGRKVVDVLPA